MQITLEADYAIRILDSLAQAGQRLDAATIAEETHVTQRFCLKILRKLVVAKLVRSFKGAGGGYELGREPGDISLRDAIVAIEGPILINRCLRVTVCCGHMENPAECFYHNAFAHISRQVSDSLAEVTLDRRMKGKGSAKEWP